MVYVTHRTRSTGDAAELHLTLFYAAPHETVQLRAPASLTSQGQRSKIKVRCYYQI